MTLVQHIGKLNQFILASAVSLPWLAVCAFIFLSTAAEAQDKTWEKEGEGEIKDVQIEIVKDRKILLPKANRNFDKVPPRPFEPVKPTIVYDLKNFKFATPDYKPSVRPLKLQSEELSKIYGNYISGGLGNYPSFFFEAAVTTKRDKDKFMGAHLYNRSFGSGPVDGNNSAAAATQLQVFGKSMGKDVTVSGEANYENRGTYFYGYKPVVDVDRDKIRQTYTQFGLSVGIENTKTGDFNYSLRGGYSNLQDHYRANEGELSLDFKSNYVIDESSKILVDADYALISRKDSAINTTRHLFRIRPAYQFSPMENLLLTTGVNIAFQNDQYNGSKDFHLYPHVKAEYALSPSMGVYGMVTGDMDKVNLHSLVAENLWLDSNIPIYHTNRSLEMRGGIVGKLGRKISVGAGFSVAAMKNYYYYINVRDNFNPAGVNVGVPFDKFSLVYDGNTKRLNPFAEISFAHADVATVSLRADYFSYETAGLQQALHRPTYRISANSRFNIYEKIVFEAGFIAQGGMKSLDPISNTIISLDGAFDLNMKVRYFLSKQVSAFVQLNNMLSSKYPLYQSYPARGFQALAGVSWSF